MNYDNQDINYNCEDLKRQQQEAAALSKKKNDRIELLTEAFNSQQPTDIIRPEWLKIISENSDVPLYTIFETLICVEYCIDKDDNLSHCYECYNTGFNQFYSR